MRNLTLVFVLAAASCASPAAAPAEPAPAPQPVVIQVHYVRDLAASSGEMEELTAKVSREVASAPGGGADDVSVTPHGTAIVVVAPPQIQGRVTALLLQARADANPGAR